MHKINRLITKYSDLIRIMEAYRDGEKVQFRGLDGWIDMEPSYGWPPEFEYRIKPKQQDSIDVTHVHSMWKFMARDGNGAVYLFTERPALGYISWLCREDACRIVNFKGNSSLSSYSRGETHWRGSLVDLDELRKLL